MINEITLREILLPSQVKVNDYVAQIYGICDCGPRQK